MGHKYDYEIDLNDDGAPARVVRMVGRGKRVLEIGAGAGNMTRTPDKSTMFIVTRIAAQ